MSSNDETGCPLGRCMSDNCRSGSCGDACRGAGTGTWLEVLHVTRVRACVRAAAADDDDDFPNLKKKEIGQQHVIAASASYIRASP